MSLRVLVNTLAPESAKWRKLGTQFGFTHNDLDGIKQSRPHGDVTDWLTDMLDKKMKRSPEFRWSDVIQALVQIGCGTLAESIQREHCPQGEEEGHEYYQELMRQGASNYVQWHLILSGSNTFLIWTFPQVGNLPLWSLHIHVKKVQRTACRHASSVSCFSARCEFAHS